MGLCKFWALLSWSLIITDVFIIILIIMVSITSITLISFALVGIALIAFILVLVIILHFTDTIILAVNFIITLLIMSMRIIILQLISLTIAFSAFRWGITFHSVAYMLCQHCHLKTNYVLIHYRHRLTYAGVNHEVLLAWSKLVSPVENKPINEKQSSL